MPNVNVSADGKTVKFTLSNDPQEYVLIYDFNKIVEAEEKTGVNLMQGLMGGGSAVVMRALLFAFLLKAHPDVLIGEAGDLFSKESGTVMAAMSHMLLQFGVGMEGAEGTEEEETGAAGAETSGGILNPDHSIETLTKNTGIATPTTVPSAPSAP